MNEPHEPPVPSRPGERMDRDEIAGDVDALHARNVLRGVGAPAPEAAFRARVKRDFATGALGAGALGAESARPEGARAEGARPQPAPLVIPLPRRRRSALWTGVAVAAAIVIAVLAGVFNQGPAWTVTAARGNGEIVLDGEHVAASDLTGLGRRLVPGVQVQVADGSEVDLRSGGVIAMRLTGGTDLVVPPSPPRWFARRSELYIRRGEIRVMTGPEFPGARLDINTPDAAVQITGTTFAVILEPTGTCVCVYQGMVHVGPRSGPMGAIAGGNRRYVFKDRRPPEDAAMRENERTLLADFQMEQHRLMEGGRAE